ncbi:MAG: peptidylprolyl isomerase [Saprospiraceae bacterium]
MALIGKIRDNYTLVIIVIALGIGLFIFTGFDPAGGAGGATNAILRMGEIDGTAIDRNDFDRTYAARFSGAGNTLQNRESLWQFMIAERLLASEAETNGIRVSGEEITDLEFGANPSPVIQRNFQNPQQPGVVDRQQLAYFQDLIENNGITGAIEEGRLAPNFAEIWRHQRREIVAQRLQEKLTALVSKGMYTPSWMAQDAADQQANRISAVFLRIPYADIADSDVSVSDEDLKAYLDENKKRYRNDVETREMEYVAFDVVPTREDSAAIRTKMTTLAGQFAASAADRDSTFALGNGGSFNPTFVPKDRLSEIIADTLDNLTIGGTYGPYREGNAFKVVKLRDRTTMPDSADTRHILLSATTPAQVTAASQRADSLIAVIEGGGDFGALAAQFSQDPGSKDKGGVYEAVTPGQFVPEFDAVLFRTGEVGPLYKVKTQFGFHIIEVLKRSASRSTFFKVAYAVDPIVPGKQTEDEVLDRAEQVVVNNRTLAELRAAIADMPGLRMQTTAPLSATAYSINGLGSDQETRNVVCAGFALDAGQVDPNVYTYTDPVNYNVTKYVIAGLRTVIPAGVPPVDVARDEIMPAVVNRKKAELIKGQIKTNDLRGLASQFGVALDTVSNVALSQATVPKLGSEPAALAAMFRTASGSLSSPVTGETGVFIVQPLSAPGTAPASNMPAVRGQMNATARGQVTQTMLPALRAMADVKDDRAAIECNN